MSGKKKKNKNQKNTRQNPRNRSTTKSDIASGLKTETTENANISLTAETNTVSAESNKNTGASELKKSPASAGSSVSEKHKANIDNHQIMKPEVSYAYILILFVLLIIVFVLKLMTDKKLEDANEQNEQLKAVILSASENITQLSHENNEQKKQIEALSLALNARTELAATQKKEEEESSVPELYPVKGNALVVENSGNISNDDNNDENLLRFDMNEGSYAIATGNGIIEILSDGGDGFINIVIDHGNGYKSSYTGEGIALKEAGDEIKRGDAVMIFTGDGMSFTYSLSLNGKTIHPTSVMEIDG